MNEQMHFDDHNILINEAYTLGYLRALIQYAEHKSRDIDVCRYTRWPVDDASLQKATPRKPGP